MSILSDDAAVRFIQRHLGVTVDGVFGNASQAAFLARLGVKEEPEPEPATPGQWTLDARSLSRLEGVHPDLVKVVKAAATLSPLRFTVLEGLRTVARQRELVAKGASQTMRSRHLNGHAVDIAPLDDRGQVSWDWPLYHRLAPAMKRAAKEAGVAITWGGDWVSFKDGPHWELEWRAYP